MMQVSLANLSDNDLKRLSYLKASHDVNDKKHKRISNMLFYSIPLAAGLARAVDSVNIYPKDMFELEHENYSKKTVASALDDLAKQGKMVLDPARKRSIRLARFGLSTMSVGVGLALFNSVFGLKNVAEKHVKPVNDFSKKHPILANLGAFSAGALAVVLGSIGAGKLLARYSDKLFDAYGVMKTPAKLDKFLAESKVLDKASKYIHKVPDSAREIAKGVIGWGPLAMAITYISHGLRHESVKNREYVNNYMLLKDAQNAELAEEVA